MPMTTDRKVAISISARVCMPASHRPSRPMMHSSPPISSDRPIRRVSSQATTMTVSTTDHHGAVRSSFSNQPSQRSKWSDSAPSESP